MITKKTNLVWVKAKYFWKLGGGGEKQVNFIFWCLASCIICNRECNRKKADEKCSAEEKLLNGPLNIPCFPSLLFFITS